VIVVYWASGGSLNLDPSAPEGSERGDTPMSKKHPKSWRLELRLRLHWGLTALPRPSSGERLNAPNRALDCKKYSLVS